jgi:hypothetical protein
MGGVVLGSQRVVFFTFFLGGDSRLGSMGNSFMGWGGSCARWRLLEVEYLVCVSLGVWRMYDVVVVGRGLRGEVVRLGTRGVRLLVRACVICASSGSSCPVRVYLRRIIKRVSAVPWVCCSIGLLPW